MPRLYDGDHAFILQNDDRRVVFVIPYEERYTLIGTTDVAFEGDAARRCARATEEIEYLCRAANRYFARPVDPADVVWSYCGVRPLYDDGTADPSAVTRDYMLRAGQRRGRGAGAVGLRRQDHHLPPARRARAREARAVVSGHAAQHGRRTAPLPGGDIPAR